MHPSIAPAAPVVTPHPADVAIAPVRIAHELFRLGCLRSVVSGYARRLRTTALPTDLRAETRRLIRLHRVRAHDAVLTLRYWLSVAE